MSEVNQLYNRDFNLWIEKSIAAIKNRDFASIDWDNLLIEIEDMGKSQHGSGICPLTRGISSRQKRALESYTIRLIQHILKLKYWEAERERNAKHWKIEIRNFRREIIRLLEDSPSLKNYLSENYANWYDKTVAEMRQYFDIPDSSFLPQKNAIEGNYE